MAKQKYYKTERVKSIKSIKKGDILIFKTREDYSKFRQRGYLKGLQEKSYMTETNTPIMIIKGFKSKEEYTFLNRVVEEDKHLVEAQIIEFEL